MEHFVVWHRLVPAVRDEFDEPKRLSKWLSHVASHLQKAGGRPMLAVGYSFLAAFDAVDTDAAIRACLSILDDADRLEPAIPACFGAALGDLDTHTGKMKEWVRGSALDRAQLLAHRTKAGSIALGPAALEMASRTFLLGRQVATGATGFSGQTIDRVHPLRSATRPAVRNLGFASVPHSVEVLLGPLVSAVSDSKDSSRVILRGSVGSGAHQWIRRLEEKYQPKLVLHPSAVPGSLEPLGSLRLGLLRAFGSVEQVQLVLPNQADSTTLAAIAAGQPVPKEAALSAMSALVKHHQGPCPAWIVLDPLASVDPATVQICAELTKTVEPSTVLIARLPASSRIPGSIRRAGPVREVELPELILGDGLEIAKSVLGDRTAEEVVRRVAVLGGKSPLGIEEAARALVSSGDLVYGDPDAPEGAFVWRVGPRSGLTAAPIDSLLEERLGSLEKGARRVLQSVCAAPVGVTEAALRAIAKADGVGDKGFNVALKTLRSEAMLEKDLPLRATSDMLRISVMQGMPPARLGELYRFTGQGLTSADDGPLACATSGYFVAEGGDEKSGAEALLHAGRLSLDHGYRRAAIRLAATAVQFDGSRETRKLASALSKEAAPASARHIREESEARKPRTLEEETVSAIGEGDFERVERILDSAVAEGANRSTADRLRAMMLASKNDAMSAMQAVARAKAHDKAQDGEGTDRAARNTLARGLVLLSAGEPIDAVRAILSSLQHIRSKPQKDRELGEAAALRALSLCLKALGRENDATAVVQSGSVAPKPPPPPPPRQ